MPRRGIWRFALIVLIAVCLTNAPTSGQLVDLLEQENLQRGVGNHLILIFAPGLRSNRPQVQPPLPMPTYNFTSQTGQYELSSSSEERGSGRSEPNDEDAYHLYHVLRTTEENQNLDDKVLNTVEKTKSLLRPMLRSRCNRLQHCVAKCRPRKKRNCEQKCKIKIDVYAVCERPCRPPKCGRTLPPSW